jgi:hypothetical protein
MVIRSLFFLIALLWAAAPVQLDRIFAKVELGTTYEKLEFIIEGLSIESDSASPKIERAYASTCDLKYLGEWEGEFHFYKNQLYKMRFLEDGDWSILEAVYRKVRVKWESYLSKKSDSEIIWMDARTRISLTYEKADREICLEVSDIDLSASAKRYVRIKDEEP